MSQKPSATSRPVPIARTWAQFVQTHAAAAVSSGVRILSNNDEAFSARLQSIRHAQKWIAIQTYLWHDDDDGRTLFAELLAAADRGVEVYLLIDDMDVRGNDFVLALVDQHPRIKIRLFNPFQWRWSGVHALVEVLWRGSFLNHRMHNKAWIVDGLFAIVGGRNIGSAYFRQQVQQQPESSGHFVDLDAAMVGQIAVSVEAAFWQYWRSPRSVPIQRLRRMRRAAKAWLHHPWIQQLRQLPTLRAALQHGGGECQADWFDPEHYVWENELQYVADDPQKGSAGKSSQAEVVAALAFHLARTQQRLRIISPYFIPGTAGVDMLAALVARGVQVQILTNSLASNDVLLAHAGYAKFRADLLHAGVELFELKATPKLRMRLGSSRASLHTKAMLFDQAQGFIGSFNLSARSANINTESGIFIKNDELSAQLSQLWDYYTTPERAIQVNLQRNGDKYCRWWRRLGAWFAVHLPLESQL